MTVPEGWWIGATGELQNPEEVLSEQSRARLNMATNSHDVVHVVMENDREPGTSTLDSPIDLLTWRFMAVEIHDFAFGTSDKYLWDATTAEVGDKNNDQSNDLSMIHAFYRPEEERWSCSAEFAQFSIEFLSSMFMPYPYPQMTTVEGIIGRGWSSP